MTDVDQAARARSSAPSSELGRLDTLINNAGVMLLGPAVGAPLEEWQRMLDVNVARLLYCAHAALPHLLRAAEDGPRQSPTWSTSARSRAAWPGAGTGVYNLTKHGVGAFSESLRQEVARRHVRVSLVEPGAVDTELAATTARDPGGDRPPLRRRRAAAGRGHRRRDPLHRHATTACRDQRGADPPDRAG